METDLRYAEINEHGFGISMMAQDVVFTGKSDYQKVDIIQTPWLGRVFLLDGLVMTTEKDEFFYHEMIAHVPMNSVKSPERVLVIGGGDGGTVREVLKYPSVKEVVLCEIDGLVVEAAKKYLPTLSCKLDDPKVTIKIEDAIEYMKDKKSEFDVILIDSTDPMGPGEGLFTEEFYTNVKNALKPGGVMAAQSESPFANAREQKMMYALLKKVFRHVKPYAGPMPCYPAGYWSWAFCSEDVAPLSYINEESARKIEKDAKLYNLELHKAVFSVPNFVKRNVGDL